MHTFVRYPLHEVKKIKNFCLFCVLFVLEYTSDDNDNTTRFSFLAPNVGIRAIEANNKSNVRNTNNPMLSTSQSQHYAAIFADEVYMY